MARSNKILSLLGLAAKARHIVSGEFMTEKSIKEGAAYLVIVADDASENTKKNFHDSCKFYEVPIFDYGSKNDIGHAIGKEMRASIAITDEGLANSIIKQFDLFKNTEEV